MTSNAKGLLVLHEGSSNSHGRFLSQKSSNAELKCIFIVTVNKLLNNRVIGVLRPHNTQLTSYQLHQTNGTLLYINLHLYPVEKNARGFMEMDYLYQPAGKASNHVREYLSL